MIFLVVLIHTSIVYESTGSGAFFWIVDDYATNQLADILLIILDIFIMATIFFISGYLTPLSLKSKNSWQYIKTKFKRLIVPWGIAVLTLLPLYKFIYLYSRNIPQETWTNYFHFNNSIFSQNWLWFLPVLFMFDLFYLGFSKLNIRMPKFSLKWSIAVAFVLGLIYSFTMDILNMQGWTKTIFLDFQNERLLIYFMIFLLGGLCYDLKVFESQSQNKKLYITLLCTVWIPVGLYHYFYTQASMNTGIYVFSEMIDAFMLWVNFHIALLSLLYLMIYSFKYFLDKQGKLLKELSNNSYNVYIIHVVVMGLIAIPMLNMAIPSLLKFLILTVFTFALSNVLVHYYRVVKGTWHSTLGARFQKGN